MYAELDGSNQLLARYLHGVAFDQTFARVRYEPTTPVVGSTPQVLAANVCRRCRARHAQQLHPTTGVVGSLPILFASRQFDAETGLYYNRARYLDPTTGRWTTQDPMGFAAGDANLYRYVGNTPTMLVDPSGYIWSWAAAGIGAGIGAVVGTVGYLGFNAITGRPITWGGVAGAAAGGAVAGGIAGGFVGAATGDPSALVVIGGGVLIGAGSGAAGGLVSSIVSQEIDHGRIDWEVVAVDTAIGGAIGGVLGGVGGGIKVWLRPRPGIAPARHTWQGPSIQSGVGQTALRNRAVVNQIKYDMFNGRYWFEAPEGRIGGW